LDPVFGAFAAPRGDLSARFLERAPVRFGCPAAALFFCPHSLVLAVLVLDFRARLVFPDWIFHAGVFIRARSSCPAFNSCAKCLIRFPVRVQFKTTRWSPYRRFFPLDFFSATCFEFSCRSCSSLSPTLGLFSPFPVRLCRRSQLSVPDFPAARFVVAVPVLAVFFLGLHSGPTSSFFFPSECTGQTIFTALSENDRAPRRPAESFDFLAAALIVITKYSIKYL
jgi:hypothetical protein